MERSGGRHRYESMSGISGDSGTLTLPGHRDSQGQLGRRSRTGHGVIV